MIVLIFKRNFNIIVRNQFIGIGDDSITDINTFFVLFHGLSY